MTRKVVIGVDVECPRFRQLNAPGWWRSKRARSESPCSERDEAEARSQPLTALDRAQADRHRPLVEPGLLAHAPAQVDRLEPEGAGKPIRPRSRRGLVLVNEPSEHVSTPNTVEGDDDL